MAWNGFALLHVYSVLGVQPTREGGWGTTSICANDSNRWEQQIGRDITMTHVVVTNKRWIRRGSQQVGSLQNDMYFLPICDCHWVFLPSIILCKKIDVMTMVKDCLYIAAFFYLNGFLFVSSIRYLSVPLNSSSF